MNDQEIDLAPCNNIAFEWIKLITVHLKMSIDIVEGIWNGFWFLFYRSKSFIVIVIVSFHFLALDLTVCIWEVLCFVLNLHSILSIWNDIGLKQPGFESNVSRYWKKIASKDLDLPRISLPWTMSEEIFVKYHNWEKKKICFWIGEYWDNPWNVLTLLVYCKVKIEGLMQKEASVMSVTSPKPSWSETA